MTRTPDALDDPQAGLRKSFWGSELRSHFLWNLWLCFAVLILLVAGIVGSLVANRVERSALDQTDHRLEHTARVVREIVLPILEGAAPPDARLQEDLRRLARELGTRLTILSEDGRVLADSDEDPSRMENHGDRPEVREARESGVGRSSRFSHTVERDLRYLALAVRSDEGEVLGTVRAAEPLLEVSHRLDELRRALAVGVGIAALGGLLLAFLLARRITRPVQMLGEVAEALAAGDYGRRVEIDGPRELRDLADAFNEMSGHLQSSRAALEADRNKLEAILGSMVEGVIAVDRHERIVHLNRVGARILGQTDDTSIGRPIWEVARSLPILDSLTEAVETEETVHRVARLSTHEERWLDLRACPLRAGGGDVVGAVLVLDDVTQLRRLETIRRDFVANVSHELKTPIAAIQGMVETLLEHPADDELSSRNFLQRIKNQCRRVGALVTDLLSLSRLEGDAAILEAEHFDLREVLRETARVLGPSAEQRSILVHIEVEKEPIVVLGDREALGQAVSNLLDNAIKYSPEGSCVVARAAARGRRAVLEVEDEGIGIDARHQERIFERFYRVDKARSREVGGTGLGLAIVKHTALSLGGEVSVTSAPGEGSVFCIELPLVSSDSLEPLESVALDGSVESA